MRDIQARLVWGQSKSYEVPAHPRVLRMVFGVRPPDKQRANQGVFSPLQVRLQEDSSNEKLLQPGKRALFGHDQHQNQEMVKGITAANRAR